MQTPFLSTVQSPYSLFVTVNDSTNKGERKELFAYCVDWIESGRTNRREQSSSGSAECGKYQQSGKHTAFRQEQCCSEVQERTCGCQTDDSAEQAQQHSLQEKCPANIMRLCAERQQNADLPCFCLLYTSRCV